MIIDHSHHHATSLGWFTGAYTKNLKSCLKSLGETSKLTEIQAACKDEKNMRGYCLLHQINTKFSAKIADVNFPSHGLKCEKLIKESSNDTATHSKCRDEALDTMRKTPNKIVFAPSPACLKKSWLKPRDLNCKTHIRNRLHYQINLFDQAYQCEKKIPLTPVANVSGIMFFPAPFNRISNFL